MFFSKQRYLTYGLEQLLHNAFALFLFAVFLSPDHFNYLFI